MFFGWKNLAELFFMVQRAITFRRRKQQLQCFLTEKGSFSLQLKFLYADENHSVFKVANKYIFGTTQDVS